MFLVEGVPLEIVTDNGPQFISKEFEHFLEVNNIKHTVTPVYHARANGLVERWNRTLKYQLEISLTRGVAGWRDHINRFLFDYRATSHATTGASPSKLLHGREVRVPYLFSIPSPPMPRAQQQRSFSQLKAFKPGDVVRCKYTNGKIVGRKIVKRISDRTYELSDGHLWHRSRLSQ